MKRSSIIGLLAGLSLASFAQASTTWTFDNGTNGDMLVTNKGYTQNSTTLTAYAVDDTNGNAVDLWNKHVSPEDFGIGTAPGVSNEIDTRYIVELNVSAIAANTSMSILMSSLSTIRLPTIRR